jgi:hypothetical protein
MRDTIKKLNSPNTNAAVSETSNVEQDREYFQNLSPSTIEESQTVQEERTNRINDLLNKMPSSSFENDGSKLSSFNPPPRPEINQKKPSIVENGVPTVSTNEGVSPYDLLPPRIKQSIATASAQRGGPVGNFTSNDRGLGVYSNYKSIYNGEITPVSTTKPYYANMGISSSSGGNDKLMEKINYMIHLLEEQQGERTNNVTEELILYTFLGVFIIYIVDSFARAGKYVR